MNRTVASALLWGLTLGPIALSLFLEGYLLGNLGGWEAPLRLHARLLLPAALAAAAIAVHLGSLPRIHHAPPPPPGADTGEPRPRVRWLIFPLLVLCASLLPYQIQGAMKLAGLLRQAPWETARTCKGSVWTVPPAQMMKLADGSRILTLRYRHNFPAFASGRVFLMPHCTQVRLTAPGHAGGWPLEALSGLPEGKLPSEFEVSYRLPTVPEDAWREGRPLAEVGFMAVGFDRSGRLLREEGLGSCELETSAVSP